MTLFDAYLAVGWSARGDPSPRKPASDAVWVGERLAADKPADPGSCATFFRTRSACLAHLRARLRDHVSRGRRVFLGFDFAYGYPAGFTEVLDLQGAEPPWRLIWNELEDRIEDHEENANNRFVVAGELNMRCPGTALGPYWGCPADRQAPGLRAKSPRFSYQLRSGLVLEEKRETERRLPGTRSTWKLFGAGAVGGQTLLGIPAVAKLRDDPAFANFSRVWPFETGFDLEPVSPGTPSILHVEIWPGVVNDKLDPVVPIKDQAQVCAMVNWLAELDAANELLPRFGVPAGLAGDALDRVLNEEGWIFGAGH